jgi:serine/threonine-protein kinase RsbW
VSDSHLELGITNDLAFLVQVRELVAQAVKESGFPTQFINRLQIAVDEAVTNIIEHGYAGQPRGKGEIAIRLDVTPERFRIEIADDGASFDPNALSDLDIASHVAQGNHGGLGVFLMRKIMDVVDYRFEHGVRNRLVLVKNR